MEDKTFTILNQKPRFRVDLSGKRFGKLTILSYEEVSENVFKWKCQCDCGNITYKTTSHLNAGTAVSCGCKNSADLTGKRFGQLVVMGKSENRKDRHQLWVCKCDCGNICEKTTSNLNSGFARSCGCDLRQPAVYAGARFGRLVAVHPTDKRDCKSIVWECQCDCGKSVFVRSTSLSSGHTTSCGCFKADIDCNRDFKDVLTYVDNTCIEFVENISKPTVNTSSDTGVRGVILRGGRYQAVIYFRKKRYYLGRHSKLEDAIDVRRKAEARVEEYLEAYKQGLTPDIKFDVI